MSETFLQRISFIGLFLLYVNDKKQYFYEPFFAHHVRSVCVFFKEKSQNSDGTHSQQIHEYFYYFLGNKG